MRTNVKVVGFEELLSDIGIAKEQMKDVVQETIEEAGLRTRNYAVKGIQTGPATGIIYKRGNKIHQASRAGEYPMSDRGARGGLVSRIHVEGFGTPVVSVGTNDPIGRWLELGTEHIRPRPWLFNSAERAKTEIIKDAQKAFAKRMGGK